VGARFCLECGQRLRPVRAEGRVRLRCPTCGWTRYVNPIPAAVAIIERGGCLLLTRRARAPYAGTWDLPGGFLEGEEAPATALRRELREELGIRVRSARFLAFATDRYGPRGLPVLALVYRVTASGVLRPADDVSEARWFPRRRVPLREVGFPSMRRVLRAYLRGRLRAGR
jgi:ADP-ribose pyrophosphatase YjhB (NUDIX family)